jgi:hypothetical protein
MPTMEDKASQASGSNKPKPGLLSSVKRDYKKARKLLGSIKSAWAHARKPSVMKLARHAKNTQHSLSSKAAAHQQAIANGEISFTSKK